MTESAGAASTLACAMRRWVAAGLLVIGLAIVGASCRAVFGLDDYQDSSSVLCETLTKCYENRTLGQCGVRVETRLEHAAPEMRAGWLAAFSDRACLESCSSARRCLDILPLCDGKACVVKEDCCGFVAGRTECNVDQGKCCRRKGNACTTDGDCCPGAGSCSDVTKTCGGVVCLPPEAVCLNDYECCTGRCDDFHCADTICSEDGFECGVDSECCSGSCDPSTKRCGTPACGVAGSGCGDDTPCCPGLTCYMGVCSDAACFPPGSDCVTDDQCCSSFCDPAYYLCGVSCGQDGEPCSVPEQCCGNGCEGGVCTTVCSTTECTQDVDCCTGKCSAGLCGPECVMPSADCFPCDVGAPLQIDCTPCASTVCATDPYCCCVGWDSLCVTEAVAQCPGVCG